jgi:hypothetical protein
MHFNVYDIFYSLCSHQNVLAVNAAIFKVILLIKEYKGKNVVSCVAVTFLLFFLFCFTLLSCECFFPMSLVLSDVYWHFSYSDAIDAETCVCVSVCMYVCTMYV